MSRSIERLRAKRAAQRASIAGDAGDTTSTVSSALSELVSKGGGMLAEKQKKDAADAAAKKAAADDAIKNKDKNAAIADMQAKQKAAAMAQADAHQAQLEAATETDPNGPLHVKAKKMADLATMAQAQATAAADKVAFYGGNPAASSIPGADTGKHGGSKGSGLFTPMNIAIGVGVVGVLGTGMYLLLRKKK